MEILERHAIIDDVLLAGSASLGADAVAYRGHVYRVLNYARRIYGSAGQDDALALASAFHDMGIWSDRTFDYVRPSRARALAYASERWPDLDAALIARVIEEHHKLTRVRAAAGVDTRAVEAFRKADRVDVSRGLLRGGVDRSFVREATAAFPYAGFHGVLIRTALAWFLRHPLRPLPMLRL